MRKFLGFLIVVVFIFVLISLLLPARLAVKKEIVIANNSRIIYNKMENLGSIAAWISLNEKLEANVEGDCMMIKQEGGNLLNCRISERKLNEQIKFTVENKKFNTECLGTVTLKEETEQFTSLKLEIYSHNTLQPLLRYAYWFDKGKIEKNCEKILLKLKNTLEQISYERFTFSRARLIKRLDTVFSIPKKMPIVDVLTQKTQEVDSVLKDRLFRYRMLDTTQNSFIKYTQWGDSLVEYVVCVPVVRMPSKKQAVWLKDGAIKIILGNYYSVIYKGAPQDLSLAWDSLYTQLKDSGYNAKGFPLEQLMYTSDSIEQRQLFIKIR